MNRTALNLLVDLISFIAFLASTASGLVLLWALPAAGGGFRGGGATLAGELFLGISRPEWLALHRIASLILAALILLHIALHWRWIRNRWRRIPDKPSVLAEP
jgi:hypothetical protein